VADGATTFDAEDKEPGVVSPSFESNVRLTLNAVVVVVVLVVCAVLNLSGGIWIGGGSGRLTVFVNEPGAVRVSWNVPCAPGVSLEGPEIAPFISPAGVIVTVGAEATNVGSVDRAFADNVGSGLVVVVPVVV